MATSVSVTVGTTPVQLASGLKHALVQNLGAYAVFLGGSNVSDTNGLKLPANSEALAPPIGLIALESLYGVVDSGAGAGTCDVRVLTYTG